MDRCRNCGAQAVGADGMCTVCKAVVPSGGASGGIAPSTAFTPPDRFAVPDLPAAVTPPRKHVNPWLVIGGAAVILGVGVALAVGAAAGDDSDPAGDDRRFSSDRTGEAGPLDSADSADSADDTSGRTCWDGSVVDDGEWCASPTGAQALQYAFPQVDFSTCVDDAGVGTHFHPGWSYRCEWNGSEIHFAEYVDASSRNGRLARYGQCMPAGEDTCVAGPSPTGRYVMTYDANSGLLFYASSPQGLAGITALTPRSADELLFGERAS